MFGLGLGVDVQDLVLGIRCPLLGIVNITGFVSLCPTMIT